MVTSDPIHPTCVSPVRSTTESALNTHEKWVARLAGFENWQPGYMPQIGPRTVLTYAGNVLR